MPLIIKTARLVLRPLAGNDRGVLNHWMNHPSVADTLGLPAHPQSAAMTEAYIERARVGLAGGNALMLAICESETVVGVVAIEPRGRGDNLSYWLVETRWGKGFASEAAAALIAAWFERSAKRTALISGTFSHNAASLQVQKKLGFQVVSQSMVFSHFNRREIRHWDTRLTRERWAQTQAQTTEAAGDEPRGP